MFQEMFPILSTPGLPRALRFYRDLLGCTVTYRFPPEGGVRVLVDPADQPWGERMAEVADFDGNRVIVASRK
jgi:lactoylglutathione lyase